jgi:L-histidine Nalpha-methyltransferase
LTVTVRSYLAGDESSLGDDVLDGLTRPFKELPPKHFYDRAGAELFDRICELPEYYPTRAERAILGKRAGEIAALTGAAEVVELGSGTATKTRILLSALADAGTLRRYLPVDVTEAMVRATGAQLAAEYPGLDVHGIVGDFERHLGHLPAPTGPRIIAFLGGTIGNFKPQIRRSFLARIASLMYPEDRFLLGADLVKDRDRLEAAYNDSAGVTAEFNKNLLLVLNRELGADFDPGVFAHLAFWDELNSWMDIRLRSLTRQTVTISNLGMEVEFADGEEMRTEISAKFTREQLEAVYREVGLEIVDWWTDPDGLFALSLARRSG